MGIAALAMTNIHMKGDRHNGFADPFERAILAEASSLCQRDLAMGTPRTSSLRMLGMLTEHAGLPHSALALTRRTAASEPANGEYLLELTTLLVRRDTCEQALASTLAAITRCPDSRSFCTLGRVLYELDLITESAGIYRLAFEIDPVCARAHAGLGDALRRQRRLSDAIAHYERSVSVDPQAAEAWCGLGYAWLGSLNPKRALESFDRACALTPDLWPAVLGRVEALQHLGRTDEAFHYLQRRLRHDASSVEALGCFVNLLAQRDDDDAAVEAWLTLAATLQGASRYDEAAEAYRQALRLQPGCFRALTGFGFTCLALAQPEGARRSFHAALTLEPMHTRSHIAHGQALQHLGHEALGWDEFTWRYRHDDRQWHGVEQPVWDGSPLDGRTILMWGDQGHGDVLLGLRYVAQAKRAGGRVIVECNHPALVPVVERMDGVDAVVTEHGPMPAFDVHVPLVMLPALVGQARSAIGIDRPYLTADPMLIQAWRRRLRPDGRMTIGLSWGGNAGHRSAHARFLPVSAFAPLADVPGVRLVSLQHGPQTSELLALPPRLRVERIMTDDASIADAAALIMSLDLVVTVDTMIAHLVGALCQPVWLMLRYATDWVWGLQGTQTRWYPTMRLFRQPRLGDWASVVADIRVALMGGVMR